MTCMHKHKKPPSQPCQPATAAQPDADLKFWDEQATAAGLLHQTAAQPPKFARRSEHRSPPVLIECSHGSLKHTSFDPALDVDLKSEDTFCRYKLSHG